MVKTKRAGQIAHMPDVSATREAMPIGTNGHRAPSGDGLYVAAAVAQPMGDDAVRTRAFALYCERGCVQGFDVDDWCQAERELRSLATTV